MEERTVVERADYKDAWLSYIEKQKSIGRHLIGKAAADHILRIAPVKSYHNQTLLMDLGCGDGMLREELSQEQDIEYIGIDGNAELIKYCQERFGNPESWMVADISKSAERAEIATRFPNPDLISCIRVLNNMDDLSVKEFLIWLKTNYSEIPFLVQVAGNPDFDSNDVGKRDPFHSIQAPLTFEGITITHYLRSLSQYIAAFEVSGFSHVETKVEYLGKNNAPSHFSLFGKI